MKNCHFMTKEGIQNRIPVFLTSSDDRVFCRETKAHVVCFLEASVRGSAPNFRYANSWFNM